MLILKRQVPGRLFAIGLIFFVCASSKWSEDSLIYALTETGGEPARYSMIMLACLAFAVLFDTIVNDMLPERFEWQCGVRYRQSLWMWIAVTYTGLAWVSSHFNSGWWLAAYYVLCGTHCVSVAVFDMWYEHVDRMRSRRVGDDPFMTDRRRSARRMDTAHEVAGDIGGQK